MGESLILTPDNGFFHGLALKISYFKKSPQRLSTQFWLEQNDAALCSFGSNNVKMLEFSLKLFL
jgi:hypothetical protein